MKKVELLAPAKNLETAIAAINSGADAIYIGASDFGARYDASNSLESITELVNYAHKFYVKVHVTINTILNDNELNSAIELIKSLYNIGVDAIIIQDMGLLKAAIENKLPPIQLHMSTQCDNRTLEKVKFFDEIGVSRVILARELSEKNIANICENIHCEVETFIHGALCVSYSGQCYMSFAIGGRSANRGVCAQPCRRKYTLINDRGQVLVKDKYLLSLKDFNASESIEKLINYGVKSFKIEGRLKDVNYVKNVTYFYNLLINNYAYRTSSGAVITDFKPNLSKTFNRLYTNYFLKNRSKCYNLLTPKSMGEYIGNVIAVEDKCITVSNTADLASQDGLLVVYDDKIDGFLVNRVQGNKIYPNKNIRIPKGAQLYRNLDFNFDKLLKTTTFKRKIRTDIKIENNTVIAIDEDNNIVSVQIPKGENPNNPDKIKEIYIRQLNKTGESDFIIGQISVNDNHLPFMPISALNKLRSNLLDKLMEERLRNYKRPQSRNLKYAKYPCDVLDYRANIMNDSSKSFYECSGCSVSQMALEYTKNIPSGIELMRTKHCIKYAIDKCRVDMGQLYLLDDYGKKYPLKFDCQNCEMAVLSP